MMRLQVYALSPSIFFFLNAHNYFETDNGPIFLKHETVSYSCKAGLLNFQNTKRETFLLEEKAMEVNFLFPLNEDHLILL